MKVKKEEEQVIRDFLEELKSKELVSEQQEQRYLQELEPSRFDWHALTTYSFLFAIICIIIATVSLLADNLLLTLLDNLWESPHLLKSTLFGSIAAFLLYKGQKRKQTAPQNTWSNETFFLLGIVAIASALSFLGLALNNDSGHFSLLILLATLVYAVIGIWLQSRLVWFFSLISLGAWFGTETGYLSQWDAYYFGMNYPLRFALLGLGIILLSFVMAQWARLEAFISLTRLVGVAHLLLSLWVLSITGNYGDWELWLEASQVRMITWVALAFASSCAVIYWGLKTQDEWLRGFGISFLFLFLYTQYFVFLWDVMHKALFFFILAASFWIIGRKAEQMGLIKKK
ncbi:hypothetical protein QWY31_02120 [Cytophagales bacterium LB-30]|uniref:DUF2157 domain-containing protein n=1 Tax=Shiella aurantiaca TaxID=3058365 RepID=A0ABT8F200_9BACT|nr:hypothetical protein [Shiella aurantiaca]MDN4164276.1 hypothetical protein [Shiella aurantiaca]